MAHPSIIASWFEGACNSLVIDSNSLHCLFCLLQRCEHVKWHMLLPNT